MLEELKSLEDRWQAVISSGTKPSLSLMVMTLKQIRDMQRFLHSVEVKNNLSGDLPPGVVKFRHD